MRESSLESRERRRADTDCVIAVEECVEFRHHRFTHRLHAKGVFGHLRDLRKLIRKRLATLSLRQAVAGSAWKTRSILRLDF